MGASHQGEALVNAIDTPGRRLCVTFTHTIEQQQQPPPPIHLKFDNINFNHLKGAGVLHNNLQPIPDCLNASQEKFRYPQSKLRPPVTYFIVYAYTRCPFEF